MTYTVEVASWRGSRWMRITADDERLARIIASRKIWPRRGEYIRNLTKEPTA